MSDIPEDIRATAASSIDWTAQRRTIPEAIDFIARALLSEREATEARTIERCAKVALTFAPATQDTWSDAIAEKCEEIAAAIRSQAKDHP